MRANGIGHLHHRVLSLAKGKSYHDQLQHLPAMDSCWCHLDSQLQSQQDTEIYRWEMMGIVKTFSEI